MVDNYAIYHDINYPTNWISLGQSRRIVDFFANRGFVVKDANSIRDWMNEVIRDRISETIVVFSQDIMPDTIVEAPNPHNLVNDYLASNGRILWFGDIPFYYKGYSNGTRDIWAEGGLSGILGVNSLPFSHYNVQIAQRGQELGISSSWLGLRPVQNLSDMEVLAGSQYQGVYRQVNAWIYNGFIRLYDTNSNSEPMFLSDNQLENAFQLISNLIHGLRTTESQVEQQEISIDRSREIIENIFSRFHLVAQILRNRRNNRPDFIIENEHDVQDFLHVLLKIYFEDIRREEPTPSDRGGYNFIDIFLPDQNIGIEVKKTGERYTERHISDDLNNDISRYRAHSNCNAMLCFIYDPDFFLTNPSPIITGLSLTEEDFEVRVYVYPLR